MSSPSAPIGNADRATPRAPLPAGITAALRTANLDPVAIASAIGLEAPERLAVARPLLSSHEREAFFDGLFHLAAADDLNPAVPSDIALRLGAAVRPELMGVIGLAVLSAPDYASAVARCARYKRLVSELDVDVTRVGTQAWVSVKSPHADRVAARGHVETELAFFVSLGRSLVAGGIDIVGVELSREGSSAAHDAFFRAPVSYGVRVDRLRIDAASLARPLLSATPEAYGLLSTTAERALSAHHDPLGVARRAIDARLVDGARLSDVAASAGTTPRTLQRQLRKAGTSFSKLVEETRRESAVRHLRAGELSIDDIAYVLGFSSATSFARAFRQWTGRSPSACRGQGTKRSR